MPISTLHLGIFYMPQIYDMGPTPLLPLWRKACWGIFRPKNGTASAGFEPANLSTKGQHATSRPPKPILLCVCQINLGRYRIFTKIQKMLLKWIPPRSNFHIRPIFDVTVLSDFALFQCISFHYRLMQLKNSNGVNNLCLCGFNSELFQWGLEGGGLAGIAQSI